MKRWTPTWAKVDVVEVPIHPFQGKAEMLVTLALLSAIATIFQSMGGFLPGIGLLLSPFSTAPIFVANWLYPKQGFLTYFVTIFLLWIMQPSELVVFPFTTGILGVALGISLRLLKQKVSILLLAGGCLTMGINIVLIGLKFPLLGPIADPSFNLNITAIIFICSILYSWLWLEGILLLMKKYFARKN